MKMVKKTTVLICLIILALPAGEIWSNEPTGKPEPKTHVYINGPSISKHLYNHYGMLNEWHPGIGAELQHFFGNWFTGINGHYMSEDSNGRSAYWTCFSGGYRIKLKEFWIDLSLIAGGLKKREYREGRFSLFGLPVISVGYKWIGFNISYIPEQYRINKGLLIFQLKMKIHSE